MDQEKETKRQAERCRALAQRIVRELTPASIQVLGGSGALAEALEKTGAQLLPENAELGTAALLVVEDPEWVDLPALKCAQVLLVCTDASAMADCAKQLAASGSRTGAGSRSRSRRTCSCRRECGYTGPAGRAWVSWGFLQTHKSSGNSVLPSAQVCKCV